MNYYNKIKNELLSNELNKRVKDYSKNKYELQKYYNVGKLLFEAGKHYGEGIIREYSTKLTKELGKGYSKRNLWLMLKFYELIEKLQTVSAHLTWSHYCELLYLKNIGNIYYYNKNNEGILRYLFAFFSIKSIIKYKKYDIIPNINIEVITKFKLKTCDP